jgi:serine/threonine protein kinase
MIETTPPGTVLHGRYRIEKVLGSGGFGHVYLAIDLRSGQQYAVKEYLVTGASGHEQLKHESNVLSQLHHPNLPAFHDAFSERGRYYVVLNYIEGNDLTDLIRLARQHNEVVSIARILEWLLAICDAVIFLHSQHPPVIHRDIKPDNIRITPDETAVLVDLGNAKAAADGARTLFFIRHQGTPGYAPLEQYPGGSGTDVRSDVYALGGTLYFALTAHEPPSVSTRQAVQPGQPDLPSLQQQLANNPPEDSAGANVRQFRLGVTKPAKPAPRHSRHLAQLGTLPPDVLERLNAIIQKSMAMKPVDRYQSVAEFAADLRQVKNTVSSTPGPSRQVDAHSTQPDLPMLYEAIQAARERAEAENPSGGVTGAAVQGAQGQESMHCPRCNAPLGPKASFCPRCGIALSSSSPQNSLENNVPSARNVDTAASKVPKMLPEGDVTAEQTLIIDPKSQFGSSSSFPSAQANAQVASVGSHANAVATSIAHASAPGVTQVPPAPSVQARPLNGMIQQGPPLPKNTSDTKAESRFGMRLLLVMAIVLIILVLIMILLITQTQHGHVSYVSNHHTLTYQLQRAFSSEISFLSASR